MVTSKRCRPAIPMVSDHDECTSQGRVRLAICGGGGSSGFFSAASTSSGGGCGGASGLAAFLALGSSFFPFSALPPFPFSVTAGSGGSSSAGGSTLPRRSGPKGNRPAPFAFIPAGSSASFFLLFVSTTSSWSGIWIDTGTTARCKVRMSFSVTCWKPSSSSNSTHTAPVHDGLLRPSGGGGRAAPSESPSGAAATRLLRGPVLTGCASSPDASNHGTVTEAWPMDGLKAALTRSLKFTFLVSNGQSMAAMSHGTNCGKRPAVV
mmetsp:Transcript_3541/g.8825  ORF Transcript_3541/g.8825 Transcript_3541/m.8825 type:complete len:264 (-) Transcript_3541:64-855(-)